MGILNSVICLSNSYSIAYNEKRIHNIELRYVMKYSMIRIWCTRKCVGSFLIKDNIRFPELNKFVYQQKNKKKIDGEK